VVLFSTQSITSCQMCRLKISWQCLQPLTNIANKINR